MPGLWKTVAAANPPLSQWFCQTHGLPMLRYDSVNDCWPRTCVHLRHVYPRRNERSDRDIHRARRASIERRCETTDALSIQATVGVSGAYDEMTEVRESCLLTERSGNHGHAGH
jgi:hypothetical protein